MLIPWIEHLSVQAFLLRYSLFQIDLVSYQCFACVGMIDLISHCETISVAHAYADYNQLFNLIRSNTSVFLFYLPFCIRLSFFILYLLSSTDTVIHSRCQHYDGKTFRFFLSIQDSRFSYQKGELHSSSSSKEKSFSSKQHRHFRSCFFPSFSAVLKLPFIVYLLFRCMQYKDIFLHP